MRRIALCFLLLAGCASAGPQDLQKMSIAEVCYLGALEPQSRQMAADEVRRRSEDCSKHADEIAKLRDQEQGGAAGMMGGMGGAKSGMGGMGGGMGRGY